MKVFRQLKEIEHHPNTVLTIGTFDGIHLGHQEILKKLFERSIFHNARSFLITFDPHPRKVISKADNLKILSTPKEKEVILGKMGLENLFVINFTKEFSQQQPIDFFTNFVINKIGLKEIVIGHDHKFGKGREGTSDTLKTLSKKFNFDISMVDEFNFCGELVSSTKIRQALINGNVKQANSFLGRNYSFSGTVISGDKRGRSLGFPTANIKLNNSDKLLPGLGIYAAQVKIGDEIHFGLLSIGRRPTFYVNGEIVPEVYIYDFDKDIYDQQITINLLEKIRKEEKFSSSEELIAQMHKDREAGINIFNQIKSANEIGALKN